MKNKILKVTISCLAAAVIGTGCFLGYKAFFTKKVTASTAKYYTASARKMNLEVTVQGTGSAYSSVTKDVSPSNNGTLKSLNVKVGDTVKAGQKLFVSDSDEVRKNVTTAKNNLEKQELALESDENAQMADANKVAQDKISVSDAESQLSDAYAAVDDMTVTAPIGGLVTAVNNSNGDSVQSGKSILTIEDMSSIKIKVSVDELDIKKIKAGQTAQIKFDAIEDKTYEGSVETISQTGNTSNNVTTYDVVVSVKSPAGIMLGMNANVTIQVESKENALVIPAEALIESNGQKFVRVQSSDSTSSENAGQSTNSTSQNSANSSQNQSSGKSSSVQNTSGSRLVTVKTGLETENYIEITEGLSEGETVLVTLPQTSSTTNNNKNSMNGNFGGGMDRSFGGNMSGGQMPQGGNSSGSKNQ